MRLYLVQHGDALPKEQDPERPLSEQGRADVASVARFAQQAGVEVYQIRHSGKRRAAETAGILAAHLKPSGGVTLLPGPAPDDDVYSIAELLSRETRPLMFVGHLPFMERLAGFLVTGDAQRPVVTFQEASTRTWSIRWAVTPDLIPPAGE
jgi:phosphohistidine phosphatase